jgi:hypothetical protein
LAAAEVVLRRCAILALPAALLRIAFNILRTPAARRPVMQMRAVFNRYADYLCAVAMVAVKP